MSNDRLTDGVLDNLDYAARERALAALARLTKERP